MKQQTKLSQRQEPVAQQQTQTQAAKEFASADELLRFDATQTSVPPEIAQRLQKTAANLPPPPPQRGWWKNLFGG
jgi:hypothetical protein